MSIFLFLLSIILSLGALWLAAKFLGRIGLIIFTIAESILLLFTGYSCAIFGISFPLSCLHFVCIVYFAFYFYNKYSDADCYKLLITAGSAFLYAGLTMFLIFSFAYNLDSGWRGALAPILIWLLTFGVTFAVGLLMQKYVLNIKNQEAKAFLNLSVSIIVGSVIFVTIPAIGVVAFGTMLLQILMTILWSIVFLAILFFFDKFLLNVRDESQPSAIKQTVKRWFTPVNNGQVETNTEANKETDQPKNENFENQSNEENLKKYFIDDKDQSLSDDVESGMNAENSKRKKF